jgi:hypothetical protein
VPPVFTRCPFHFHPGKAEAILASKLARVQLETIVGAATVAKLDAFLVNEESSPLVRAETCFLAVVDVHFK